MANSRKQLRRELPGILEDGEYWYIQPGRRDAGKTEMHEGDAAEAAAADGEAAQNINRNAGHRARLRERFRENQGFEGFSDHEVLELLLTFGAPRKDMKDTAKDLLETFGNLKGVFEARPEQLKSVRGIGEQQATFLSMMLPITRVVLKCEMQDPKQISNRRELEYFCKEIQMGRRVETFWVICVNAQCRVLGSRRISEGSLSEVSAYPRLVMETALNYNAHSVFFCHNHPGGTCAPSAEDIASTLQLQRLLNGVGIALLDHMIIAGANSYSMAQHGDIEFGARGHGV
ncbi:MAG: DNA repair protein RadC [Clostridia bacterium]|nr:DNA repair protein RadC [Clostridia bacterium]